MTVYNKTIFVEGSAPGISAAELNKMGDGVATAHSELDAHINDAAAAHAASAIAVTPAGSIVSTDVQAAIQELDSEKLSVTGKAADSAALNGYAQNTAVVAGTIPVRDAAGKVPGSITGDAVTLGGATPDTAATAGSIAKRATDGSVAGSGVSGLWTDTTTAVGGGASFTKRIAIGPGKKSGMLVASGYARTGAIVQFSTVAANACSWSFQDTSIAGFMIGSGGYLSFQGFGSSVLAFRITSVYIDTATNELVITFVNNQGGAYTLYVTVSWEVWA